MHDRDSLCRRYLEVRGHTEQIAAPLSPEDQQLQAFPSASPVKWHRGHTTWFFETFLLAPEGISPHDPQWGLLFNSYYEAVGPRHARPQRGLLSRPSCDEIAAWRSRTDEQMVELLMRADDRALGRLAPRLRLGLAHEEQHQELMLTDIVAALAHNPLRPAVREDFPREGRGRRAEPRAYAGGLVEIGANGADDRFTFDNEGPRHAVFLRPFSLSDRLLTVGEWSAFAEAGGYRTPSLWLSDGIDLVRQQGIDAPAYCRREGGALVQFGPGGERELHPDEPCLGLSLYEADAIATFFGGRLPTEAEWEHAASSEDAPSDLAPASPDSEQRYGIGWQWTRSAYLPYPGFKAAEGALGEYNGKFMNNQAVLRGSSRYTPPGHSRPTYRNFWPPETRFQRTALRIAFDGSP